MKHQIALKESTLKINTFELNVSADYKKVMRQIDLTAMFILHNSGICKYTWSEKTF